MPGAVGNRNGNKEIKKLMTKKIDKIQSDKNVRNFFDCTYRDEKFQRRDRGSTFQNLVN